MNQIFIYINDNYKNKLNNFIYISNDKLWQLKKQDELKLVQKDSLKYIYAGKIVDIDKNWIFIKSYNHYKNIYKIIYPEKYYIYVKKYLNKNDQFRQSLENIINKLN